MPIYTVPNSDVDRLTFLKKCWETGSADRAAGNNYLEANTLTVIGTFLPQFEGSVNTLSVKFSTRSKEIREKDEALAKLQTHLRDFWEVSKRRAYRLNQPAEVLTFYQLALDGQVPNLPGQAAWLTITTQVIKGEAEAVKAGYPAMLNPSAAELQTVLTSAQSEAADVAQADRDFDQAQEAVALLRPQADELIQEVMDQLRYSLRKKDAASQRRIMRSYGAAFRALPGEPADAPAVANASAA